MGMKLSSASVGFGFLLVVSSLTVRAEQRHQCGTSVANSMEFKWCIDLDTESKNPDVVYYFHGAGRSEHSWRDEGENQDIQKAWLKNKIPAPTVISVSFGKYWLMSAVERGGKPSRLSTFVNDIMPALERSFGGVRGRRMIKAESMGGFNASQLLLKAGALFERGALACPAITPVGPYSPIHEIGAFFKRNDAFVKPELLAALWTWTRFEFANDEEWQHHNPLRLVERVSAASPRLYVSCGERDEFGFFEGTQAFAKRAKMLGTRVIWQPMKGGHCRSDANVIARFLAP